ncbi:MAG: hypothetical protein V4724_26940 [Pseudomonadota bacterium]
MDNATIEAMALAAGFKLKEQPGGAMALNPYVFNFAHRVRNWQPAGAQTINAPRFYGRLAVCIMVPDEEKEREIAGLIAHIDAWGARQREAGRRDILHPKGFDEGGSQMVTRFITVANDMRERAEKAEAALADQMALVKKAGDTDQAEFNRKWAEQKNRADRAEAALARLVDRVALPAINEAIAHFEKESPRAAGLTLRKLRADVRVLLPAKTDALITHNLHTGALRDPRDVASDPQAVLCVAPGEPLHAAAPKPCSQEEWAAGRRAAKSCERCFPAGPCTGMPAPPAPAACTICDGTRVTFGKRCECTATGSIGP